jgi:DNA repair protein RadC
MDQPQTLPVGSSESPLSWYTTTPSGDTSPSEPYLRLTRRLNEAARILQIQMLDYVIIGEPMNVRQGYFSLKEAGTIG